MSAKKKASRNTVKEAPLYLTHAVDFRNRVVYFDTEVCDYEVSKIIRAVEMLARDGSGKAIHIKISSFGGDPYIAMGFYDFIKTLEVEIITEVVGMAMSAATVMFLAGDTRLMSPNSTIMVHTVSTLSMGRAYEIKGESEECDRIINRFCKIYSDETTLTQAQWKRKIKYEDIYIDQEEALKLGFLTE